MTDIQGSNGHSKGYISELSADSVVLEKAIFANVFEKDIRRVYIYRKAERLAKSIYRLLPAFKDSMSLKDRLCQNALDIIDSSLKTPGEEREALSRALLTLSSLLTISRDSRIISVMNADIIIHEAHTLLQEISVYEDPRIALPEVQSISALSKSVAQMKYTQSKLESKIRMQSPTELSQMIGSKKLSTERSDLSVSQTSDNQTPTVGKGSDRRGAVLNILKSKGASTIKDISTVVRDVSEKTIQRELQSLVASGVVSKTGERRWTVYSVL